MSGPFEMPAGYDAWKTRTPYDDWQPECCHCDDHGCDICCETDEARDLEDLEERCGDNELPVLEQSQSDDTEANRTMGHAGRPRCASGPNSGFDSRDGGQP